MGFLYLPNMICIKGFCVLLLPCLHQSEVGRGLVFLGKTSAVYLSPAQSKWVIVYFTHPSLFNYQNLCWVEIEMVQRWETWWSLLRWMKPVVRSRLPPKISPFFWNSSHSSVVLILYTYSRVSPPPPPSPIFLLLIWSIDILNSKYNQRQTLITLQRQTVSKQTGLKGVLFLESSITSLQHKQIYIYSPV